MRLVAAGGIRVARVLPVPARRRSCDRRSAGGRAHARTCTPAAPAVLVRAPHPRARSHLLRRRHPPTQVAPSPWAVALVASAASGGSVFDLLSDAVWLRDSYFHPKGSTTRNAARFRNGDGPKRVDLVVAGNEYLAAEAREDVVPADRAMRVIPTCVDVTKYRAPLATHEARKRVAPRVGRVRPARSRGWNAPRQRRSVPSSRAVPGTAALRS